jgi:hypothetical protein
MSIEERHAQNITGTGESTDNSPIILMDQETEDRPLETVLLHAIANTALDGENALFSPLQGIGKSRQAASFAVDFPSSIFTELTDNYDEFEDWTANKGNRAEQLPTSHKDCETIAGEYPNDPTAQKVREARKRGWPLELAHRKYEPPCSCGYMEKKQQIDPNGLTPLVGNTVQAHNWKYVDDRHVFFDESAFENLTETYANPIERINQFLQTCPSFEIDSVPLRLTDDICEDVITILDEIGVNPYDYKDFVDEFHGKAPLLTYALFGAERMENGQYIAELPGDRRATYRNLHDKERTDENGYGDPFAGKILLFDPPDLSGAKSITALDANPCLWQWEMILGEDFTHYRCFDDDGRNQYLHDQGYRFRQMNNYVWAAQGGNLSTGRPEACIRAIGTKHEKRPNMITSLDLQNDFIDRDLRHLWDEDQPNELYYGNVNGKNDIDDSNLLVVLGSPSRSDWFYQYYAALAGENAEPATDEDGNRLTGTDLDYQSEAANELHETITRGETFQAMMRAGRRDDSLTHVYVGTCMIPDSLNVQRLGQTCGDGHFDVCLTDKPRTQNAKDVIEVLTGAEEISAGDIIDETGIHRDAVKTIRQKLQSKDLIEKTGTGRWARYTDVGLDEINVAGECDLTLLDEDVNDPIEVKPIREREIGNTPIESSKSNESDGSDTSSGVASSWTNDDIDYDEDESDESLVDSDGRWIGGPVHGDSDAMRNYADHLAASVASTPGD